MSTADQLQPSSRVMAHEVDKVARLRSLQFSCVFKTAVKYLHNGHLGDKKESDC